MRARNGVEEPAQDFHVRGHVLVVDGGSKNFVCQIIGDLLEEALACGLFMFQVMVHAQTHVQHQVQTQDAVVNPRRNKPGRCTIRDSKHQKPPTMKNEGQIDHSDTRLRQMAAAQTLLTQNGSRAT